MSAAGSLPSIACLVCDGVVALQVDYKIEWTNGEGTFTREFSYDEQGLLAVLAVSAKQTPTLPTHGTARHGTGGQSTVRSAESRPSNPIVSYCRCDAAAVK